MTRGRIVPGMLVALAIAAGTIADRPCPRAPLTIDGYRVLAVDFHTHSSIWSDGTLTPWGLALEADRQGLDAIAITGHDQTLDSHIGRWVSERIGGSLVLMGSEVLAENGVHMIAAGIRETVRYRGTGTTAIEQIHRQGGIAIVAHPFRDYWDRYDPSMLRGLDGTEICHPAIYTIEGGQRELEAFAARQAVAAIGSSDFHGLGPMGTCRTYVFAATADRAGIIEAIRARRTLVFGKDGRPYGDAALLPYADRLRGRAPDYTSRGGALDWFSRLAGLVGLSAFLAIGGRGRPDQISTG
jgi:PHP domain-containing protein